MRFATIAVLATVAFVASAQDFEESTSYIADMLQAPKGPKKPKKLNWVQDDAVTLITDAWGVPYLTAQANPAGGYQIGYGHVGKEVKAQSVITEEQAASILMKDLKAAVSCYQSSVWNKYWSILTNDAQNTAMVSFVQSIGCTSFKKIIKNQFTKTTVADDLNTIFEALIAAGDATATASDYLTARRTAEKELFGITAVVA